MVFQRSPSIRGLLGVSKKLLVVIRAALFLISESMSDFAKQISYLRQPLADRITFSL